MADDDIFDLDEIEDNLEEDPTFGLSSTHKKRTTQTKKRQVKPKVCSEWSDIEIFKLISCVECLPMLWNARDLKYRNKIERQYEWKRISETKFENKFTDNELMAKWSNLRIQYRSYFSKYRKSKSGQGANESVKWKFYDAMEFVGRAEEQQTATTVSNLVNTDEGSVASIDRSLTSTPQPQVSKRRRLSRSSSKTTTSSSAAFIVAEGMKDAVNQLKEQRQKREDEFDAFGKYVATELRSISDPSSAQRVRFKVARFLMDCIEAEMQSTSQVYVYDEDALLLNPS